MGEKGQGEQRQFWLLKTEPDCWSWQNQTDNKGLSVWDGVRNVQAQKLMKSMSVDDLCLFYHTGKQKEVAGVVRVVKTFYPDPTDQTGKWGAVDVQEVTAMKQPVTLAQMKDDEHFKGFLMLRQPRLSVVPVEESIWERVCELGGVDLEESLDAKKAGKKGTVKRKTARTVETEKAEKGIPSKGGKGGKAGKTEMGKPAKGGKAEKTENGTPAKGGKAEKTENGTFAQGGNAEKTEIGKPAKGEKAEKTENGKLAKGGKAKKTENGEPAKGVRASSRNSTKPTTEAQTVETTENGRAAKEQAKAGAGTRKRGAKEVVDEPKKQTKSEAEEAPTTGSRAPKTRKKKAS